MSSADELSPEPLRPADAAELGPAATLTAPANVIPVLAEAEAVSAQGWWASRWRVVVLAVSIAPVVLCGLGGLGCLGLLRFSSAAVRHMEPYRLALDTIQGSSELQAVIGEPIEADDSFLAAARAHLTQSDDGEKRADIFFVVVGPQGRADVAAKAFEKDDSWKLSQLEAHPAGGERIVILAPRDEASAAAFGDD